MTAGETFDLALMHYSNGRLVETEGLCRQILADYPQHGATLHLLAVVAQSAGHLEAAVDLVRRAIASDAEVPEYHSNLGAMLAKLGRFGEAASACRDALVLDPDLAEAHYNLGNALQGLGELPRAVAAYRRALGLRFDYPQAHNNLGNVLKEMGELEEAAASYRQAVMLQPDYAHACSNLANILQELGRHDEAMDAHRRALALAPARPEIHSNLILGLHYRADTDDAIVDEARLWNARHAEPLRAFFRSHGNDRTPDRLLRIGLVSSDLRMHSVAFFVLPLLEAHDRQSLHVTCYATSPTTDAVSERMKIAADAWSSLHGLTDDDVAHRIREDRIDILVDLNGHTSSNRLMLFARKPAPIQVTWLGFPGTTGLTAIDYRMTDAYADPARSEAADAETLARLAPTAWCFAPLSGTPPVAASPAARNGHVTFGSFNNFAKVAPQTLQVWARILQQVPGSRLLLKSAALRGVETRTRIERLFTDRGIASTRIELVPNEPSQLRHLQRYDDVDIALDTFPYHGVTTTCEAMWMGVPTVVLAGARHASRVGVSLLSNVGHPEWIATTHEAYVERAVQLAADRDRLAALRSSLREEMQRSPLMDGRAFAHSVEAALRAMWHRYCAEPNVAPPL